MDCSHPTSLDHYEHENENNLDQKKRNKDESNKNQQQEDCTLILTTQQSSSLDHDVICNKVPNDILIEILVRLNQNHAIQCKLVCKEWYALISNPIFTDSIVHHHPRVTLLFRTKYGFGFSGALVEKREQERCLEAIMTNEQRHQVPTIPHSIKLTTAIAVPAGSFELKASCMDHFLFCYKMTLDMLHYIIYNPLTNHCRVIPPINYPSHDRVNYFVSGFFCVDPVVRHSLAFSAAATPTGIYSYHYKVVSISTREKDFDVLIFCSQANKWEKHKVLCPHNVNVTPRCYTQITAYRQKLHWTTYGNCTKALVVYDPLRYPRKISQLIDFPAWEEADDDHDGNAEPPIEQHLVYRLGVCKDRLRISLVTGCLTKLKAGRSFANYNPVIVVWELIDYENPSRGWKRIFKIYVFDHRLVVLDTVRTTRPLYLRQNFSFKRHNSAMNGVVAFHPTDDDLVYVLRSCGKIFLCDLRTEKMRVVFDGPPHVMTQYPPYDLGFFFLLVHSHWPTQLL